MVRTLWDRLGIGGWIDRHTEEIAGRFRPSLMVEVWVILLLYGGGVLDDLPLLARRHVRRLFGWKRVPDPTTFGRWLRRAGQMLVPPLDRLLWRLVLRRWAVVGTPERVTLVLDSTVSVRYGETQAGAEDWLDDLVARLRAQGIDDITVRLDKGFFSRSMVAKFQALDVDFLLKIPAHRWLTDHQRPWRRSTKGEAVFPGHELWTTSGTLWGGRLLSLQARQPAV